MSVNEFSGIGFAPGVVTGARSFKVDRLGRLTGINLTQVWRPGENTAECRKDELNTAAFSTLGGNFTIHWAQAASQSAGSLFGAPTLKGEAKRVIEKAIGPKPHSLDTCTCGFYAYYDGSDDYHREEYVSGVVEGYGETLIGTRGFRAMKSRIIALHIPTDVPVRLAALVARNYPDVPLLDSFDSMVAEFPPDAAGMAINPVSDPDFWTRDA